MMAKAKNQKKTNAKKGALVEHKPKAKKSLKKETKAKAPVKKRTDHSSVKVEKPTRILKAKSPRTKKKPIIDSLIPPAEAVVKEELKQIEKPVHERSKAKAEIEKQHDFKESPAAKVEERIEPKVIAPEVTAKELELKLPISVKDLAVKLQEKPSVIIKILMGMGIMVGINQGLEESVAVKLCEKYNFKIIKAPDDEELALRIHQEEDSPEDIKPRSPVVTLMGHVDHGKTSLLDAIRKSKITESEHGGITQHIGAYRVILPEGEITFLDTPGHEAFTAMRARGARITDIVILVVAADDGLMPQTQEAIDHARAAAVPIIVALNKIDKPQADADRVKKQLSELDLTPEDWGGKTITVAVSAKTGTGIDNLLEMILLEAQMLELRANFDRPARGVVIESKLSKGKGPVATLLVQNGTLHLNQNIIVGNFYAKIRAMFNDRGQSVTSARPSFPVEILGLSGVPQAGDQFFVVEDEKKARELSAMRVEKQRQHQLSSVKRISLEDLHAQIEEGKLKELKLIIKADVQGSIEAIKQTLNKLNVSEIKLDIIHTGVGSINTSDIILAVASNALILGFNVTMDERARELADKEAIDVRTYTIIYELANDIKSAVEGMLEPKIKKVFLGRAEIRKVFRLTRSGTIAGCFVTKGKINRSGIINLIRNGEVVFEGKLSSLKRFKDDVRDVQEGYECGMAISGYDDLKEGDIIEAYDIEKIARKL